ncbi:Carbohydrate sulfotransferase 5 [Mizuhopecten yessoensis]|uniref:Carbohydrate sulfotransferase 5 n=2 Tax=Mizuhopecten yessoensis TaxID=6573 RepID=A0A210Q269_MIZYE|nr:Carbohydrate sulfotransferase 5 [Mizuhopecten yessoensis]
MTRTYSGCLRRYNHTTAGIDNCIHHLHATCVPAKLRVIKCIRIDMDTVNLLQQRLPFLKVIHVVRDPRGVMNSRVKVKLSNWINLDTEVTDLCSRMTNNIEMAAQMNENYVKQIVYELVAEHPIGMAEELYKFAGLELSPMARKGVYRLSHYSPLARDCDWCTKKSNSTKTSLLWRSQLDLEHARTIDSHCLELYRAMGYLAVEDVQQLRNLSIPLRLRILPPGPL